MLNLKDRSAAPRALRDRQVRVLRVGQDLDGVNFWFDRSYVAGCIELGLLPADTPPHKAGRWDFFLDLEHTVEEFVANCHQLADAGLLWHGQTIPGARTAWEAILDAGHEIHVVTDRSFGSHPVASQVGTRAFLRTNGLRYHSLTFTADKTSVPTDVMLEDKLENYDALDATACRPYLINRPWNQVPGDDRRRVDTHDEFVAEVLRLGLRETT